MYYKISNMFDYMMMYSTFKDKLPKITLDAVFDKVKILEESINKVRDFRDYGSSIMFFPTEKAFDNVYDKFLELNTAMSLQKKMGLCGKRNYS